MYFYVFKNWNDLKGIFHLFQKLFLLTPEVLILFVLQKFYTKYYQKIETLFLLWSIFYILSFCGMFYSKAIKHAYQCYFQQHVWKTCYTSDTLCIIQTIIAYKLPATAKGMQACIVMTTFRSDGPLKHGKKAQKFIVRLKINLVSSLIPFKNKFLSPVKDFFQIHCPPQLVVFYSQRKPTRLPGR